MDPLIRPEEGPSTISNLRTTSIIEIKLGHFYESEILTMVDQDHSFAQPSHRKCPIEILDIWNAKSLKLFKETNFRPSN